MTEKPYVGQTVHFVDGGAYAGRHLAAVVVWVWEDTVGKHTVVNLNVQNPGTSFPTTDPVYAQPSIPQDEERQAMGTWHFIEGQPFTHPVEIAKPEQKTNVLPVGTYDATLNISSPVKNVKN